MSDDTYPATPASLRRGPKAAYTLDQLTETEHEGLRALAHRLRRQMAFMGAVPGTDSLVHETYLRLKSDGHLSWNDSVHFLAVASLQLRHLLVDYARAAQAQKRGGDQVRVSFDEATNFAPRAAMDVLVLHEALTRLAGHDARQHDVAELRLFGGLSVAEIAAALGVSERTVKEDWRQARAWLAKQLRSDSRGDA